jgi:hypothetical protein
MIRFDELPPDQLLLKQKLIETMSIIEKVSAEKIELADERNVAITQRDAALHENEKLLLILSHIGLPARTISMRRICRSTRWIPVPRARNPEKSNGHVAAAAAMPSILATEKGSRRKPLSLKPVLDAEPSWEACDRLVSEIANLGSAEAAIEWAGRSLGAKNTLTAEDARAVEAAFRGRMQVLEVSSPNAVPPEMPPPPAETAAEPVSASPADPSAPIDAPAPVRKPPKQRKRQGSRISIEGVDGHGDGPCRALVTPRRCRMRPATLRGPQPAVRAARALGLKVSHEFTVPLAVPHPSPRASPRGRRGSMVEQGRHRSHANRTRILAAHPGTSSHGDWQPGASGPKGRRIGRGMERGRGKRAFPFAAPRRRRQHRPMTSFRQFEANPRNALPSTARRRPAADAAECPASV